MTARDPGARTRHARRVLVDELPVIAFVAGVALVYAAFRLMVAFAVSSPTQPMTVSLAPASIVNDFVQHFVAGVAMWALIQPVRHRGPAGGGRRWVVLVVTVLAAAAVAATGRALWLEWNGVAVWSSWHVLFVRFGLLAAMLVTVGEFHRSEILSLEAMQAAEADRSALDQQTLQARLKTLEAQIEPHFLFNTLANVRRLYETDVSAGEAMLDRLMRYLEVALPSMRSDRASLDREADLVAAYLDLQQVRMGRRLDFRVDIAPALGRLEVPPMVLLTLVENAIKHGLAPRRDGGRVDIEARAEGGQLRLEVSDTGRGFGGDSSGGGTGLANIRARLAAMFGDAAELTLTPRQPHGMVAAIRMPLLGPPAVLAALG